MFADASRLQIVDSGQVLLKHVPENAAPDRDSIVLAAAGGHFEIDTGASDLQTSPAILVETPAAIIHAVRSAFSFWHNSTDGLVVTIVEPISSACGTVVVENDLGTASIADPHHRIIVSASDKTPVVDQATSQDMPAESTSPPDASENGEVEVSAGGVEGAFPGDPIVVAGTARVFDLTPDPAPLQNPSLSRVLAQTASLPAGPTHHAEQIWAEGLTTSVPSSPTETSAPKTLT